MEKRPEGDLTREEAEANMFDGDKVNFRLFKDYISEPQCDIRIHRDTGNQEAKADAGKAEIRLVPMEIVWAIAWIRMYGNRKYGDPENWKTVEPERYRDALMRHLLHYISDPKSVDEESGYPHLWHAACNMAFLMHFDYGDMCHYDFAVKKPEWEKIGKQAVEKIAKLMSTPAGEEQEFGDKEES